MWKAKDTIIYRISDDDYKKREDYTSVIAFDMDGTLIQTKSGRIYPKDENDWKWFSENVILRITEECSYDDVLFAIISNQSGAGRNEIKRKNLMSKIDNMISLLPKKIADKAFAILSIERDYNRKPATGMWTHLKSFYPNIRKDLSCYIGDAAGRFGDFATSDLLFAENVGMKFHTPEQFFFGQDKSYDPQKILEEERKKFDPAKYCSEEEWELRVLPPKEQKDMILMIGMPGSGKSHFAKTNYPNYVYVNQDTLKTNSKCLKETKIALQKGLPVIIDNTNGRKANRLMYVALAKGYGYTVRYIWMNVSEELAKHCNHVRAKIEGRKIVPDVAYNTYRKYFDDPKEELVDDMIVYSDDGMRFTFSDPSDKKIFLEWT